MHKILILNLVLLLTSKIYSFEQSPEIGVGSQNYFGYKLDINSFLLKLIGTIDYENTTYHDPFTAKDFKDKIFIYGGGLKIGYQFNRNNLFLAPIISYNNSYSYYTNNIQSPHNYSNTFTPGVSTELESGIRIEKLYIGVGVKCWEYIFTIQHITGAGSTSRSTTENYNVKIRPSIIIGYRI